MVGNQQRNLQLRWQALLVAVPPFLVYLFNDQLLALSGAMSDPGPEIDSTLGGLRESGARLQYLAALLLFAGAAVAVMAAFVLALRVLSADTRRRTIWGVAAITLAAAPVLVFRLGWLGFLQTPGMPADIGLPENCRAFFFNECANYAKMISLLSAWKYGIMAATAALIFGIICCMASAPAGSTQAIKAAVLRQQAKRLNLFLYLAAMLMVSALLVQIAFLRWPRFAVSAPDLAQFDAHIGAVLLYYGVGYSIFLASFYVPAVCSLRRRADTLTSQKLRAEILEGSTVAPAFLGRQAATIFAPILTALLTAWASLLG